MSNMQPGGIRQSLRYQKTVESERIFTKFILSCFHIVSSCFLHIFTFFHIFSQCILCISDFFISFLVSKSVHVGSKCQRLTSSMSHGSDDSDHLSCIDSTAGTIEWSPSGHRQVTVRSLRRQGASTNFSVQVASLGSRKDSQIRPSPLAKVGVPQCSHNTDSNIFSQILAHGLGHSSIFFLDTNASYLEDHLT